MTHYYSEKQDSKLRFFDTPVFLFGNEFTLKSAGGVFSSRKLDRGTEILLKFAILKNSWNVLDLGCGNGVVGLSIKKAFPDAKVTLSDINKRAVKIARINMKALGLDVKIINSNAYEKINEYFNTILLNPPQSAGKDICFEMITKSKNHLLPGGLLQIVARRNKGGKHLSEKMQEVFGNLKVIARKSGYWVYVSENTK